jgi:putative MATE family efflux protein
MARSLSIDTTQGGLPSRTLQLAWPAVLQALLINFYAFNDYFFVGRLQDAAATAALSACFALLILFNVLLAVIPSGAMTLSAQAFGARRLDRVADVFRRAVSATLIWSFAVLALGNLALPWLVGVANVTDAVGAHATAYLRVIFLAAPSFALMLVVVGAFRACGNTRVPLVLELGSLVINVVLNAVLVLGPGPFPSLGVTGAAIATAVSRAIPGVVGLWLIARGGLGFDLLGERLERFSRWFPTAVSMGEAARIGIFHSLSGAIYGAVYLTLNRIAGEIGAAAQGGLGAGLRGIEWIGFAFGDGFAMASIAIVGQNIGARQFARARKGAWISAGLSALCCQLIGVMFILFPEPLCRLVTDDPDTLGFAIEYVYIMGWVMWAVGFEMSMFGAMVGTGRTQVAFVISGGINMLRVPIAVVLVFGSQQLLAGTAWAVLGMGPAPVVTGGFSALALTIGVTAILKAILYAMYWAIYAPTDRHIQPSGPDDGTP